MDNGLIPKRYAKALYKYAVEEGLSEQLYHEMKQLCHSFENHADLNNMICNPYLPSEIKEKLLVTASGLPTDGILIRFMHLMNTHSRESFLRLTALSYIRVYTESSGILPMEILSAMELPKDIKIRIIGILENKFFDKTLEISYYIEPKLIGGFIVKTDSMILDASVRNELKNIGFKLLN